jgi:hypothetical protein
MPINITNAKGRDAVIALDGLVPSREVMYVDGKGDPVTTQKVLKSDTTHDLPQLLKKRRTLSKVANDLIKDDPEIDMERFGMYLVDTSRVYVTKNGIVHAVLEFEVISKPNGEIRERRPRRKLPQNMNSDVPLKWTGKFIKKEEAIRKFVFTNKKQLAHVNGLTFDFLYDMAKQLAEKDALMLVRGGAKGNEPIVMNRGGKPYNAFLEGRIDRDSYCLLLHLSNMELIKPKEENGAGS